MTVWGTRTFFPCLATPSKSHRGISIFCIFLTLPHQMDNGCQMSARVFVVLFDTIDLSWDCMKCHAASFGNRNSIFRMKVVCNFGRSKLKKQKISWKLTFNFLKRFWPHFRQRLPGLADLHPTLRLGCLRSCHLLIRPVGTVGPTIWKIG